MTTPQEIVAGCQSTERIEQCKRDIAALQAELAKLETKREPLSPRHGDVIIAGDGLIRIVILERELNPSLHSYNAYGERMLSGYDVNIAYDNGTYRRIGDAFDDYPMRKGEQA